VRRGHVRGKQQNEEMKNERELPRRGEKLKTKEELTIVRWKGTNRPGA